MRPYLAIIKDSFREAIHSRVLWILLLLITLLLAVFVPLTFRESLTVGIRSSDVAEWPKLADALLQAGDSPKKSGARRIWESLDEETRQAVRNFKPMKSKPTFRDLSDYQASVEVLVDGIGEVLKLQDLYDQTVWTRGQLTLEGKQLADRFAELNEREIARFNRILLEASFPGQVEASPSTSMHFTYFGRDMHSAPVMLHRNQLFKQLMTFVPWFMDKFVLSIGLLVAVLVTSPLIPQTFEPGSLHLLLSKPISRVLLYVTKFIGGCAFVLVAATYLFAGGWLILGLRFGIWEHRLLWCIPIYTFVFAIYYSVAALVGAMSKSTVVSIVLAILFWGLCFGVGVSKDRLEQLVSKSRIVRIVPAGKTLIVRDDTNTPSYWNDDQGQWQGVRLTDEQAQVQLVFAVIQGPTSLGPAYDRFGDQILSIGLSLRSGQFIVFSGQREENWKQEEGVVSPSGAFAILNEPDGHVLIVSPLGIRRVVGDVTGDKQIKVFGFSVPLARSGPLREAGPESPNWGGNCSAGIDGMSGDLVVYSRGRVELLRRRSNGQFTVDQTRKLEEASEQEAALVARGASTVVVGLSDGRLLTLEAANLKTRFLQQPEAKTAPKAIAASPDGKWFAALSHRGTLWLMQAGQKRWTKAPIRGQEDISAVTFDGDGQLLVADRTTRITAYGMGDLKQRQHWSPPLSLMDASYRYAIWPIYYICPKPGEFYKTVQYLLTDRATVAVDERDLTATQQELSPWRPVASSLAFMLVMLALGCAYIHYQEF